MIKGLNSTLFALAFISFFALITILILGHIKMNLTLSPREQRKRQRPILAFIVIVFSLFSAWDLYQNHPLRASIMAVPLLAALLSLPSHTPRREALLNYRMDPQHCGQCGYDLTGNTSGICPECGWEVPKGLTRSESASWMLWWDEWEIEYLENWKHSLIAQCAATFVTVGLAIGFMFMPLVTSWFFALAASAFALNMGINTIRVIQYGHKKSRGP